MYLEKYVGHKVFVDLHPQARQDRTMRMFYETDKYDAIIANRLLAVDELGIWIEGFKRSKILRDDDGNEYDEPIEKDLTFQVMIRWDYISGVFVLDEPEVYEKRIGFE